MNLFIKNAALRFSVCALAVSLAASSRFLASAEEFDSSEEIYSYDTADSSSAVVEEPVVDISTLEAAFADDVNIFTYSGSEICPQVILYNENDIALVESVDYKISYQNNINAGTAYAVVEGMGNYCGTQQLSFTITPSTAVATVSCNARFAYTGSQIRPEVTVTVDEKILTKNRDYTLSYTNNISPGKGQVRVSLKGNYQGEYVKNITIVPKKPLIKSEFSRSTTAARIHWNKSDEAGGYYIYMKSGTTWRLLKSISNKNTTEYRIGNLSPDTYYSFRIKAYTKVNGAMYFSDPSDTISCRTKPVLPAKIVINNSYSCTKNAIRFSWKKDANAKGYKVYRKQNGKWLILATISDPNVTEYRASGLKPGTSYTFMVRGFTSNVDGTYLGSIGSSKKCTTKSNDTLYYIKYTSSVYDTKYKYKGTVYGGSYYSGYSDARYGNYVFINYKSSRYLIKKSNVSVRSGAKILQTGCIGQMGGSIYGASACGPTAAAILVNSQQNENWSKDSLILYAERNRLNDQGSLRGGGGITAPNLIRLINGYSGGKYTAKNIYGKDSTNILKKQIDSGNRAIVVVQYTSSIVSSYYAATHFVVICGYEYIDGNLYFYYADPYYGNGPRSLLRVSAGLLKSSMSMVHIEPKCIITVNR